MMKQSDNEQIVFGMLEEIATESKGFEYFRISRKMSKLNVTKKTLSIFLAWQRWATPSI